MCGGSAPKMPAPAKPPPPTYTASDGRIFRDLGAYNAYEQQLRQRTFQTDLASALTGARQASRQTISQWGLPVGQYMPLVEARLNAIRSGIPDLASDPGSYFSPNLAAEVLTGEQDKRRGLYTSQADRTFRSGFETNYVPDTFDDQFANALFQEQYDPAVQALDRARARGTLTTPGYSAAFDALQGQARDARSTLSSIGDDLLSGYRNELGGVAERARAAASGYKLGTDFSLAPYTSERDRMVQGFRSSIGDDLRSSLSDQPLFNIDALLSRGGTAQGPTNAAGGLVAAVAERRKQQEAQRGLGEQGGF